MDSVKLVNFLLQNYFSLYAIHCVKSRDSELADVKFNRLIIYSEFSKVRNLILELSSTG